jgi:hypothetical protein
MSYEPENHLPPLERYLEAVQILVNSGFVADPTAYTRGGDAQDEDRVEFGTPYRKGDSVYWLNAQSVQCVLQWEANK